MLFLVLLYILGGGRLELPLRERSGLFAGEEVIQAAVLSPCRPSLALDYFLPLGDDPAAV